MLKGQRNFPKSIIVADREFQIKFKRKVEGHDVLGWCHEDGLIELEQGMPKLLLHEIFWHELLHALEYTYGFNLTHKHIYKLQKPLALLIEQNIEALKDMYS